MQLINQLYSIKSQNITDNNICYKIAFFTENFIFKAHFPNNPITPGVCLIQICVELFEILKNRTFNINILKNIKFTAPINPIEVPEVDVLISFSEKGGLFHLKAKMEKGGQVFTKINMVLA